MIIIATSPADNEGIDIVKSWLMENKYTGDMVRVRKDDKVVWAELKESDNGQEK